MELQAGNGNTVPSRMDFLENSSGLVDEKAHSSSASPICSSTNKESTACSAGNKQPMNASNGIPAENLYSSNKRCSHMHSSSKEPIANKNKLDIQHGGSSQNGNNPSLDRIILESWEVTSKKPAGPETNPLLAFFKAFPKRF